MTAQWKRETDELNVIKFEGPFGGSKLANAADLAARVRHHGAPRNAQRRTCASSRSRRLGLPPKQLRRLGGVDPAQ